MVALIGALMAPVLLDGVDNPTGLFGYLLLITSLADAAALKMGFRWVPWLGMTGTALLFAGWYLRFFRSSGIW